MTRDDNIEYCLRYLLEQNHAQATIPSALAGRQQLLRTLMTIWEPQPIDIEYLRAQDAELQAQLADRGVVRTHAFVWKGDITRLKADAIVCPTTPNGLGSRNPMSHTAATAVHTAAGLQLRQECSQILQGEAIAPGGAIATPAYNLPAKWVIHTVPPQIPDSQPPTAGDDEALAACYRTAICLARERDCCNIAFCSIGTAGFPQQRAAEIAVEACRDARMYVTFVVHNSNDFETYTRLLTSRRRERRPK